MRRLPCLQCAVTRHGARHHERQLLAVAVELRFQIRDTRLARAQFRAICGEFFQQHVDLIAGLDERALLAVAYDTMARRSELVALNIDLASVMQAGRWKTTAMPMRYGEEVLAGLGGMARTAKAQGRA
jgi:shikimate 5-dehydrogenase